MSNLSDLLPAGAGAKVITATASGNLSTGQTVILQSDGTAQAISQTTISNSVGSSTQAATDTAEDLSVVPIGSSKVIFLFEGTSTYVKAVVGTISGTSISFGTVFVVNSSTSESIGGAYDSTNDKVVVAYTKGYNNNSGYARVLTVSGTTITSGSEAGFSGGSNVYGNSFATVFDPDTGKTVVVYTESGSPERMKVSVGEISGTSISFTSGNEFAQGGRELAAVYDTNANALVIAFGRVGGTLEVIAGTLSGTTYTFGTAVEAKGSSGGYTRFPGMTYDSSANAAVTLYVDNSNSNYLTAIVSTVSGTTVTLGSATLVSGNQTVLSNAMNQSIVYNANTESVVAIWMDSSNHLYGSVGTVSGTAITFETKYQISTDTVQRNGAGYDATTGKIAISLRNGSNYVMGQVYTSAGTTTNSSDFVGITNQAINNSASGEVVVEGGVITNASLLPQTFTPSVGSEAVFQSSATYYTASVYDPDSGKTIIAWKGTSDHGYAVVATPASDNSITYGTPVAFNSATTNYIDITYDTGQDKALITFTDGSGSNKVRAVVGTVSGTSISFGSVLEVETNASDYPAVAYSPDSANSMVVYRDSGNSNYGTARVLTVSGTSVSASSKVTFESANSTLIDIVYDTGSNKFVVSYSDGGNSNYGTAIVGSISGTTPSFGTATVFESASQYDINSAYDSANDKTVIFYKDSNTPTAIVGTVSGTSISFGTAVVVASQSNSDFYAMTFDSTANKIIVAYRDEDATPDDGVYFLGTVSGTSISFGSKQIFNDASTKSTSLSYNAGVDRTVIAYRDLGNSSYGTGIVLKITSANPNLTIGSTYYVQDDGTLSTTSSSVTAGKALANTTLLLKG
jgi:hypothetical protein